MTYMQIYKMRKKAGDWRLAADAEAKAPGETEQKTPAAQLPGMLQRSGVQIQEHKPQPNFRDRVLDRLKHVGQIPKTVGYGVGRTMKTINDAGGSAVDKIKSNMRNISESVKYNINNFGDQFNRGFYSGYNNVPDYYEQPIQK